MGQKHPPATGGHFSSVSAAGQKKAFNMSLKLLQVLSYVIIITTIYSKLYLSFVKSELKGEETAGILRSRRK